MRRLARVALIAVLLLRARPADAPGATAALARTRAPAEPDASIGRALRPRAVILYELARAMLWAADPRERGVSDERPGRGLGGAIRHLAERTAFGRRRANQTFVGRVFLEGATITRGGGASSVAARRAGAAASAAAPRAARRASGARATPRRDAGDAAPLDGAFRATARRDRAGAKYPRRVRPHARARARVPSFMRARFSLSCLTCAHSFPHRVSSPASS